MEKKPKIPFTSMKEFSEIIGRNYPTPSLRIYNSVLALVEVFGPSFDIEGTISECSRPIGGGLRQWAFGLMLRVHIVMKADCMKKLKTDVVKLKDEPGRLENRDPFIRKAHNPANIELFIEIERPQQ